MYPVSASPRHQQPRDQTDPSSRPRTRRARPLKRASYASCMNGLAVIRATVEARPVVAFFPRSQFDDHAGRPATLARSSARTSASSIPMHVAVTSRERIGYAWHRALTGLIDEVPRTILVWVATSDHKFVSACTGVITRGEALPQTAHW